MTKQWVALFLLGAAMTQAQSVQLASTPPMGWNSWNKFGCKVTENDVRAQAEAMVTQRHARCRLPVHRDRRLLSSELAPEIRTVG